MTISLSLLIVHFVADFLCQTDWMALNKSKSWKALTVHVLVYSLPFLLWGLEFAAVTFVLHFLTDAVASRLTASLWFFQRVEGVFEQANTDYPHILVDPWMPTTGRHWFFVVIGLDQLIHTACLAWTWQVLG